MSDAQDLVRLQGMDLEAMRLRKRLEEMPQLEAHRKVVANIEEVQEKSRQISAMRSDSEVQLHKLADEDQELLEQAAKLEKEIQETTDFRSINHRTRELESIAKRRNKVDFEMGKLTERVDKISAVEDQINETMSKLDSQRTKLEDEITAARDEATKKMGELRAECAEISSKIDRELLERYEHLKKTKNGIAVGILQGEHCSACRVEFPEGKLLKLLNGPEIADCPQCHRILVVEKD